MVLRQSGQFKGVKPSMFWTVKKADSGRSSNKLDVPKKKYGRYKNETGQYKSMKVAKRLKVDGPKNSLWTVQKTECVRS